MVEKTITVNYDEVENDFIVNEEAMENQQISVESNIECNDVIE